MRSVHIRPLGFTPSEHAILLRQNRHKCHVHEQRATVFMQRKQCLEAFLELEKAVFYLGKAADNAFASGKGEHPVESERGHINRLGAYFQRSCLGAR